MQSLATAPAAARAAREVLEGRHHGGMAAPEGAGLAAVCDGGIAAEESDLMAEVVTPIIESALDGTMPEVVGDDPMVVDAGGAAVVRPVTEPPVASGCCG